MKRFIIVILLFCMTSCFKTSVLNEPIFDTDTVLVKPRKELPQQVEDTTRVPITFNPSVEDWEEQEVNN